MAKVAAKAAMDLRSNLKQVKSDKYRMKEEEKEVSDDFSVFYLEFILILFITRVMASVTHKEVLKLKTVKGSFKRACCF